MNRSFHQNPYAGRPPFEQPFRPPGSQGPGNPGPNMQSPPQSPYNQNQQHGCGRGPPRHSTPFKSPPAWPNMGHTPQHNQGRSPGYNNNRNSSFNNGSSPRFGGPPNNRSFMQNNNRRQSGNFNGGSPKTGWGRGGRHNSGNFMDRSGDCNPGGSNDINKYYKHSMVEDPWRNLTPVPVKDTTKFQ